MKSILPMFVILLATFLLNPIQLFAKTEFRKGWIINLTGDTLKGFINYQPENQLAVSCSFKPNQDDKETVYHPTEIREYQLINEGRKFVQGIVSNRNVFLELLVAGKINLYGYKDEAMEESFFIQKKGLKDRVLLPFKWKNKKYINGYIINSMTSISTDHIDTLKKYMDDATPLFAKIDDIKVPSRNKLVKLVDEYNSYIDEDTYNKKHSLKRIPFNIDVVPGFNLTILDSQEPTIRFGALVDIGFVNQNKHFFFKTGLSIFTTDNHSLTSTFIQLYNAPSTTLKIPLQVEYRLSEKVIQPIISIGYNLFLITGTNPYDVVLLPAISPGINVLLGKRVSCRLGVEIQFKNNNLVSYFPTEFKRANVFGGLQIKL